MSNNSKHNLLTIIRQRRISLGLRNLKFEMINCHNGFTLIELLVSIAIIGILSTILLVNLSGFRQRTRDTTRKKDLRILQTALELYRADMSAYPATLPSCGGALTSGGGAGAVTYLKKIPCDPLGGNYNYSSPGGGYLMFACLENSHDSEKDANKGTCGTAKFTVESP